MIDSGIDGVASGVRRPRRRGRARSSVARRTTTTQGHGTFVAGEIAREPVQQRRHRRARVQRAADDREGRRRRRQRLASRRGRRDPLGGRQRRARDQPQPRRRARPARPEPRHLLAARAGGRRVRVLEGRRRRRRGRQRAAVARDAVELRALPGGAAARDRRQRDPPGRLGARLLEPRRRLQRPRGAGRRDLLDDPAEPGRRLDGRRAPISPYSDCGPVRVPRRDRHVVRGAAGLGRRGAPARRRTRRSSPDQVAWLLERSADDATPATGCAQCARAATGSPAGARSTCTRRSTSSTDGRLPPRRPLRAERRRRPVGARAPAAAAHDRGDARLLGRQHRRLPRPPRQGRSGSSRASRRPRGTRCGSTLWAPGTERVEGLRRARAAARAVAARRQRRRASPTARGGPATYYLEAEARAAERRLPVAYKLSLARGC